MWNFFVNTKRDNTSLYTPFDKFINIKKPDVPKGNPLVTLKYFYNIFIFLCKMVPFWFPVEIRGWVSHPTSISSGTFFLSPWGRSYDEVI